jgi:penicillin-binding protein 2
LRHGHKVEYAALTLSGQSIVMDQKDSDQLKTFTRRAFFIGALQGGLLAVLGGRLAWLQIAEGQKYVTLSDNNRVNLKILAPSRGVIVDRYGEALATNGQNFRVLITPEQAKDIKLSLQKLQSIVALTQKDIKRVLKQAKRTASFVPIEVKDNLSWEDVASIEVNLPELPGLSIDVGEVRSYPYGDAYAHLVGYVGAVSQTEISDDPVLSLPGFKIGKTGIEKSYDNDLRGKAGTAEVEVNVVGREVREIKRNKADQGKTIQLTIDNELQKLTQKRLSEEKSASAVIMDCVTGAVYSMSSHPSFNPNLFTRGLSAEKWEELLADPGFPLNNKAIGGQYPPGSTFKMVTALAALEDRLVTKNTTTHCSGRYEYGGDLFHCWKQYGHGKMDMISALEQSCDVYFYDIAKDLGINKISEMAYKLGLGQRLGFELKEERPGLVPDKNWKMGHFGTPWRPGETIVASIGQGYIQSTPLQLATMVGRLVNGGYAVKPWIVGFVGQTPGMDTSWPSLGLKKANLALIKNGMDKVVNSEKGTAFKTRIEAKAMQFGGKTGTAQVKRITKEQRLEGYSNEDLPWKFRHHALFVGYAPVKSPRYVCSVVVEHGGSGSAAAAPIARDLLLYAQKLKPADKKMMNVSHKRFLPHPPKKPKKILENG